MTSFLLVLIIIELGIAAFVELIAAAPELPWHD